MGFSVAKIALPFVVPDVQIFNDLQAALVMHLARDHVEPRTETIGNAVLHPEPRLRRALRRVQPPIRRNNSDVEDSSDRLVSQRSPILLGILSVGPDRHLARSALPIRKQVGAISPTVFISSPLSAPPPEFAMYRASGRALRISVSHNRHSSKSAAAVPRPHSSDRPDRADRAYVAGPN